MNVLLKGVKLDMMKAQGSWNQLDMWAVSPEFSLHVADTSSGEDSAHSDLFEVVNISLKQKSFSIKLGKSRENFVSNYYLLQFKLCKCNIDFL